MSDKLTIKQSKYCDERIKGKSQRQAYKSAFNPPNTQDKDIDVNACKLESTTKIKQRLDYLRSLNSADSIATKEDIAKELMLIASDSAKSDSVRLKAYEQLSKLQGFYDSSVNVNLSGSILTGKDKASAIKEYIENLK